MGRGKKDPRHLQTGYADGVRQGITYHFRAILGGVEDVRIPPDNARRVTNDTSTPRVDRHNGR